MEDRYLDRRPKEKVGFFGFLLALCVPGLGIVLYITRDKEVENPFVYLIAEGIGFVIRLILIINNMGNE